MSYLVAFAGRPQPTFLNQLIKLAAADGVQITAALLTEGPGCYNLGLKLSEENERFMNALTLALMPAKWCMTEDPQLIEGEFTSRLA